MDNAGWWRVSVRISPRHSRRTDEASAVNLQAGTGRRRSAPSGGSAVHEVTSVGAASSPAGAAEPALPGRRRSAPSGGSEPHEVGSVGAIPTAEPALPGRRRSAPSGGQRSPRSDKRGGCVFTSRGRGTGFAGPQAQRPLGGQRSTRSDKRGGVIPSPGSPQPGRSAPACP